MLNCTQCAEVLPDLIDGKGDPILRRRLLAQADKCERCRRCVEGYKKTAALSRHAFGEARSADTCEHLLEFLREHVHPHR